MTTSKPRNSPATKLKNNLTKIIPQLRYNRSNKSNPVFTVGHSTRPIGKFLEILKAHGVTLLADIRTIPHSRYNPQFNEDSLKKSLRAVGIKYLHLKDLGGLRRAENDSINTGWENLSFRGYADYMQTPEFEAALKSLIKLAQKDRAAIMCAEGNPFRCHRTLVADALTMKKVPVFHISSAKSRKLHKITPFARIKDGKIWYP